jgi:hypothetical protein
VMRSRQSCPELTKAFLCQRVTVSGRTYTNELRQPDHHWRSAIRFRWKAASWRRSAAFSRAMVW